MPNLKLEQIHIKQFLSLMVEENISVESQAPPEPDFKFCYNNQFIGIEHTRLIKLPDNNGINPMAHTVIANKIVTKSYSLFNQKSNACLTVSIDFRCDFGLVVSSPLQLYNSDIDPLSSFITNFVLERLPEINMSNHGTYFIYEPFDFNTGTYLMPNKIHHIAIRNTKNFQQSLWYASQGGVVPSFFECKELPIIIDKKNNKPKNYKNRYDEIWLLIVEDSMNLTSYFHFDYPKSLTFKSCFNKIYILRRSENILFELNTSPL